MGSMNYILTAFDPGKRIGVSAWQEIEDKDPFLAYSETLTVKELDDTIEELEAPVWVIEEYTVYGNVNHTGSKVETARVIGNLTGYASRKGIKVVMQPATILKIAAMHAGIKLPKGHTPDQMSSFLHGYEYLLKNGLTTPKVLMDNG